ncbi:hypothetical protein [Streptomyces sp. N35]|uniref:hypothetical protein n=1 Tax=Streptomyces sp. N35 TaxID=2795730 RepID=UPI0027DD7F92|nr:hypothetical protein [Streptomyces sp. N35]
MNTESPSGHRQDHPDASPADTKDDTGRTSRLAMRRALRREISGTIGLVADEDAFRAMQRYDSFTFDTFAAYLSAMEDLLTARASQGAHTDVVLFDPQEYAEFCTDTGRDPDLPASRARFTAEVAAAGTGIPYDGQSVSDLRADLITAMENQASSEYASEVLARLGDCAICNEDLGKEAFARAATLLRRVLDAAPKGDHHLVCSVVAGPRALRSSLNTDTDTDEDGTVALDETEATGLINVLALGLVTPHTAGLIVRTRTEGTADRAYGWRLDERGAITALTASEVFDAYCTAPHPDGWIGPDTDDTEYCTAPDLAPEDPKFRPHR